MELRRRLDRPAVGLARAAGLALAGLAAAAGGAFFLLPLLGRAFVRSIGLAVTACVWLATSIGVGVSAWDVLATIGRAIVAALLTPTGSLALTILVVVGIMALYWLQRLLESEEGSSS
jgi:TRAP-type C4-dicarboxylate transport system permease small subunit